MVKLARPELEEMRVSEVPSLIEADALHRRLTEAPDNLILVQVTSAELYQQAHIPGALLLEPRQLVCGIPPATGRIPDEAAVADMLASIGYRADAEIVLFDDEGGGWAGRLAWTLDVVGHTRWTYLNGGMHAWQSAGLAFSNEPVQAASTEPPDVSFDRSVIAEVEDVLATIEDPEQMVWDVRSAEEYAGLRSGSARAGHIPGAVNLDWMALKDPQDSMRIPANIEEQLAHLGLMDAKTIITHCQTHHRSGLSYMLGRLLHLPVRAYHGSWSEWGNRDDLPIETGAA